MPAKSTELDLTAEAIVLAAIEILREKGLDAVSMRSVSARLGVSPIPLYSRIGNKEALLDAVAEHLLADIAPAVEDGESWPDYAQRWAGELRARLRLAPDSRMILNDRRCALVEASRPLVDAFRKGGLSSGAAVQACRLLMWATIGFVAIEHAPTLPPARATVPRLSGSDPAGVTSREVDDLFELNIRYLIEGIIRSSDEPGGTV